jgi:hypothetical protein
VGLLACLSLRGTVGGRRGPFAYDNSRPPLIALEAAAAELWSLRLAALLSNQRPAPIQIMRSSIGWLGWGPRSLGEEEEAAPTKYYKYKISKQALA